MRTSFASLFLGSLAVQQAVAWGSGWDDCGKLPTCSGACNQCTDQQKSGLNFNQAPAGAISSFGGFNVGGCTCAPFKYPGGSKKKLLVRGAKNARNGDDVEEKCAQGPASKSSGPSLSCGSGTQPFSISSIQVSVDKPGPVLLTHQMPGGSTCTQTAQCGATGPNTIQNTQCGGSQSVTAQVHPSAPHDDCTIGIHNVGFDCTPCAGGSPPPSPPPSGGCPPIPIVSQPSSPAPPPVKPSMPAPPKPSMPVPPVPSMPNSPQMPSPPPVVSQPSMPAPPPVVSKPSMPAPPPPTTQPSAPPPPPAPTGSGPAPSQPNSPMSPPVSPPVVPPPSVGPTTYSNTTISYGSTQSIITTETTYQTVTSCPVTKTHSSAGTTSLEVYTTISTTLVTDTITVCTKCDKTHTKKPVPPPTTSAAPPPTTSAAPPASTTPTTPPTSSAAPPTTSTTPTTSSTPTTSTTPASSSAPATTTTPASSTPSTSTSQATTTPPSSTSSVQAVTASSSPGTTQSVVTTLVTYQTTTVCPVTQMTTSNGQTTSVVTTSVSTVTVTSVSTICTQCVAPPPATTSAPVTSATSAAPASSSSAAPAGSVPGVLPSCLKTWMHLTPCLDNADSDCFCKQSDFISNAQQCISAWSGGSAEEQSALYYLAGICANHIAANPVIVTGVPSTITLQPTPAPTAPAGSTAAAAPGAPATAAPAPAVPTTTISISTTVTVPCPAASQITDGQVQAPTAGGCSTVTVLNTAVTVPQAFISSGASATALAAGTPAPAAAAPTSTPSSSANAAAAGVPYTAPAGVAQPTVQQPTASTQPFLGAAGRVESSLLTSVVIAAVGMLVLA